MTLSGTAGVQVSETLFLSGLMWDPWPLKNIVLNFHHLVCYGWPLWCYGFVTRIQCTRLLDASTTLLVQVIKYVHFTDFIRFYPIFCRCNRVNIAIDLCIATYSVFLHYLFIWIFQRWLTTVGLSNIFNKPWLSKWLQQQFGSAPTPFSSRSVHILWIQVWVWIRVWVSRPYIPVHDFSTRYTAMWRPSCHFARWRRVLQTLCTLHGDVAGGLKGGNADNWLPGQAAPRGLVNRNHLCNRLTRFW